MDRRTLLKGHRWWVAGMVVTVGLAAVLYPRLAQSQDSDGESIAQPPLVTVIFDTSSSMQWAEENGAYPELQSSEVSWSNDNGSDPHPDHHLETWNHGQPLNLPGSSHVGNAGGASGDRLDGRDAMTVGPCMVWHAQDENDPNTSDDDHQCGNYHRPASCADDDDCPQFSDDYVGEMDERLDDMVSYEDLRLTEEANTPRHIQVKQILTGDMSLNGSAGPGCWFVPRARGALHEEQICCEAQGQSGRCTDDGPDHEAFDSYLDYDEPVPHYQEVYDEQEPGMLDGLGSTAIFSLGMYDGYRYDGTRDDEEDYGWAFPTTDVMDGDSPYNGGFDWYPGSHDCSSEDAGGDCYDMGLSRLVGPTTLEGLNDADQLRVAKYVQEAILDAGFLDPVDDPDNSDTLDADVELEGDRAGQLEEEDVFTYPMGKQPIAQASPFGPMFHDIHQFYLQGQYDTVADTSGADSYNYRDDPYSRCRARHSVLMTDGMVEPETPDGAGDGLGSQVLTGGGFGYDPAKYPYVSAEEAISEMTDDVIDEVNPVDARYKPRVHVLGVSVAGDEGSRLRDRALDKMASMAEAGNTCAEAYLGADRLTNPDGSCDQDWCLVRQAGALADGFDGYDYDHPEEDGTFDCNHPALILTSTDDGNLEEAFGLIFNQIAGTSGIEARTRPAVTSDIDRGDDVMGQYRFFSGFEVEGDNRNWRGLMRRRFLKCDGEDLTVPEGEGQYPIHEDFVRLMYDLGDDTFEGLADDEEPSDVVDESELNGHDRRRVFTSAPAFVGENKDDSMTGGGDAIGSDVDDRFNSTYTLLEADYDVLDGIRLHGEVDSENHAVETDSRIPFEVPRMEDAFKGEFDGDEEWYEEYWGVEDQQEFQDLVDAYRGRTPERMDRVMGAIYSSDPVTSGPPDLDLPIDSYRRFRKQNSDRLSMLYATSVTGQLHAIHAGERNVTARTRASSDGGFTDETGEDAADQREAWAYVPQLLHSSLAPFTDYTAPDGLMDGAPVVEDVRLCTRADQDHQTNPRVCTGGENSGQEWRTVLLQGMGMAGSGYFALDVTRTGEEDTLPDPVPMWEFGLDWEFLQMRDSDDLGTGRYHNANTSFDDDDDDDSSCAGALDDADYELDDDQFDDDDDLEDPKGLSFLGATVGEPEVGMVNMTYEDTNQPFQRAVAVFGAGSSANAEPTMPFSDEPLPDACVDEITGRAIYVVDLQSGEMIRRFTGPDSADNSDADAGDLFPADITGTPVMSGSSPADLSTRAFIGDEDGRMYRLDLSNNDPSEWEVSVFYDPAEDSDNTLDDPGPAAYQPAVTVRGSDRELVLIYGLADRGDSSSGDTEQGVIALQENFAYDDEDGFSVEAQPMWIQEFDNASEHEQMTGPPVMFNNDVYFTSYFEDDSDGDRCASGGSRIWRMDYEGADDCNPVQDDEICDPKGGWPTDADLDGGFSTNADGTYIQQAAVIRGVDITMGPACERGVDDALGSAGEQEPQLVAQTAGSTGADGDGDAGDPGASQVEEFEEVAVDLDPPETQALPLNWSVIEQ